MLISRIDCKPVCVPPLLVLKTNAKDKFPDGVWYVDVAGEVREFLNPGAVEKMMNEGTGECGLDGDGLVANSTPRLKKLAADLAASGVEIKSVGIYGNVGATHILRNGAIFERRLDLEGRAPGQKVPW